MPVIFRLDNAVCSEDWFANLVSKVIDGAETSCWPLAVTHLVKLLVKVCSDCLLCECEKLG